VATPPNVSRAWSAVQSAAAKPRAWVLMLLAVVLYIIARWAHGQPAATLPILLSGAFAIAVIALLDHGRPAVVARGLAWLFVIGAAYQAIPAFTGTLTSAENAAGGTSGGEVAV
jgi:hypothetical protein